jgi:hypothetical protein
VRKKALDLALLAAGHNLLHAREIDDEVIAVELYKPADQIPAHVKAASMLANPRADGSLHNHPERQLAVPCEREMLTEQSGILGTLRIAGEPVLIPKHTLGRVSKVGWRAIEHYGPVGCDGRESSQSARWLGPEFSEGISETQIGVMHFVFLAPRLCVGKPQCARSTTKAQRVLKGASNVRNAKLQRTAANSCRLSAGS